jgi:hypothetical protein
MTFPLQIVIIGMPVPLNSILFSLSILVITALTPGQHRRRQVQVTMGVADHNWELKSP